VSVRAVSSPALQFLILTVAGWLNRRQVATIEYLVAEVRVLRQQPASRRLRFTDAQRRRLAVKGRAIGRRALGEVAGIVNQPDGRWMCQVARNLTDVASGFLRDGYYVMHERDPLYAAGFRASLAAAGVATVRLPANSPNLNAYAGRFVRSIEEDCLERVVPLGERHLRSIVSEYWLIITRSGISKASTTS
jgi:hypothetical protein